MNRDAFVIIEEDVRRRATPPPSSILVVAIAFVVTASACTPVRPWERAKLAHPTMKADGLEGPAEAHVRAVHEGAAGGGSVAESGCGCN